MEIQYTQGNGISRKKKRNEEREINVGNIRDIFKGGLKLSRSVIGGECSIMANKETISSLKGKNIYVGQ